MSSESKFETPEILANQYRLIRELGSGGMGTIFYGIHIMTEQPVAIKVLKPDFTSDPETRERFIREAKTLARLEHPNIVQWKNSLEDDISIYLVMQYVEGDDVETRIQDRNSIPVEDAVSLTMQTLAGLSYVHSQSVIHRDLKPSNILLTKSGQVKLADFGISRIIGNSRQTKTGMTIGTFLYMSPEQILARPIDHRTDLYSMGITLYEMLIGEPPFQGENEYEICKKHLEQKLPSIRKQNASVSKALQEIIIKATQKKPEDRYQSSDEFLLALAKEFPKQATQSTEVLKAFQDLDGQSLFAHMGKSNRSSKGCFSYLLWLFLLLGTIAGIVWFIFFFLDPAEEIPKHLGSRNSQKIRVQKKTHKPQMARLQLPFTDLFQNNRGAWPLKQQFKAFFKQKPNDYRIRTLKGERLTTVCPERLRSLKQPLSVHLKTSLLQKNKDGRAVHGLVLFFQKSKGKSNGYYIGINPPQQKVVIAKITKGKREYLKAWTTLTSLQGKNSYSIKVNVQNNILRVKINQLSLEPLQLEGKLEGQTCLFVEQGGTEIRTHFFQLARPTLPK